MNSRFERVATHAYLTWAVIVVVAALALLALMLWQAL